MQPELEQADDPLRAGLARLRANIGRVFLGKPATVTQVLVGLMSRGHLLIEDVPGVATRAHSSPTCIRVKPVTFTPAASRTLCTVFLSSLTNG